jgi:hypothetical protein
MIRYNTTLSRYEGWNGTYWIAGGTGTNNCIYSQDGINWLPSLANSIFSSNVLVLASRNYIPPSNLNNLALNARQNSGVGQDFLFTVGSGTSQQSYVIGGSVNTQWASNGPFGAGATGNCATFNGISTWLMGATLGTGTNTVVMVAPTTGTGTGNQILGNGAGFSTTIFSTACNAIAWVGIGWVLGGAGTNTLAYTMMTQPRAASNFTVISIASSPFSTSCNALAWNGMPINFGNVIVAGGVGTVNTLAYSTNNGATWTGSGITTFATGCYALC